MTHLSHKNTLRTACGISSNEGPYSSVPLPQPGHSQHITRACAGRAQGSLSKSVWTGVYMPRFHDLYTVVDCLFQNRQCYHQAVSTAPEMTMWSSGTYSKIRRCSQHHCCKVTALQTESCQGVLAMKNVTGCSQGWLLNSVILWSTISRHQLRGKAVLHTWHCQQWLWNEKGMLRELQQQTQSYQPLHAGWLPLGSSPPQMPAIQSFYCAYCKGMCKVIGKKKKKSILTACCKPAWNAQETKAKSAHITPPKCWGNRHPCQPPRRSPRRTPLVCSKAQQTIMSSSRWAEAERRRE